MVALNISTFKSARSSLERDCILFSNDASLFESIIPRLFSFLYAATDSAIFSLLSIKASNCRSISSIDDLRCERSSETRPKLLAEVGDAVVSSFDSLETVDEAGLSVKTRSVITTAAAASTQGRALGTIHGSCLP